jgi:excisionase family DNA binding protein
MARRSARPEVRQLFTTGELARLIDVNPKTVVGWIDSGELRGVSMPGEGERRVHRGALRAFLRRFDYYWALAKLDLEEGLISQDTYDAIQRGERMPETTAEPARTPAPKAGSQHPKGKRQ